MWPAISWVSGRGQQHPRLAIFYGKQAVNGLQAIRGEMQTLDKALQQRFLLSKEDVYRTLAELLILEGRLPEAQQVLDLLKEEEYFDFVRRDAQTAGLCKAMLPRRRRRPMGAALPGDCATSSRPSDGSKGPPGQSEPKFPDASERRSTWRPWKLTYAWLRRRSSSS